MYSAGIAVLVWLAAGVSGAVVGGCLAGVWVALSVDEEAPDVALFMVPFGAIVGGVVGSLAALVTWLICSPDRRP